MLKKTVMVYTKLLVGDKDRSRILFLKKFRVYFLVLLVGIFNQLNELVCTS